MISRDEIQPPVAVSYGSAGPTSGSQPPSTAWGPFAPAKMLAIIILAVAGLVGAHFGRRLPARESNVQVVDATARSNDERDVQAAVVDLEPGMQPGTQVIRPQPGRNRVGTGELQAETSLDVASDVGPVVRDTIPAAAPVRGGRLHPPHPQPRLNRSEQTQAVPVVRPERMNASAGINPSGELNPHDGSGEPTVTSRVDAAEKENGLQHAAGGQLEQSAKDFRAGRGRSFVTETFRGSVRSTRRFDERGRNPVVGDQTGRTKVDNH